MKFLRKIAENGGYAISRIVTGSRPRILLYHRFGDNGVPRDVFETQIKRIRERHALVSMDEVVASIRDRKRLPRNAVALTIDDGYRDFYDVAFPVLRRLHIPATFYVTTSFINDDDWFWWDKLRVLVRHGSQARVHIDSLDLHLETSEDKGLSVDLLVKLMTDMPNSKREEVLARMAGEVGVTLPLCAPEEFRPCTWEQLAEMSAHGISIGSHGVDHENLCKVTSESELNHQVLESRRRIHSKLGVEPRHFAYPNGQPSDFDDTVEYSVKHAGYDSACVAFSDSHKIDNLMAIRRYPVSNNMYEFEKALNGWKLISDCLRF